MTDFDPLRELLDRLCPMTEAEWKTFSSGLSTITLPKKQTLTATGTIATEAYFVLQGALRLYFDKDGDTVSANFVFERAFAACYASFLTATPSRQALETIEDSKLIVLPKKHFEQFAQTHTAGLQLARRIAEQGFIQVQHRAAAFILDSPEERYRQLLRERPEVLQRVPQHYIASYLGITAESLSRIRKRMTLS